MSNKISCKIAGVHLPKTDSGWERFETLVETAERLFTASSFFDVSVADICKDAGTAVGTFYIYFDTKTDVYRYLVECYKQRIKLRLAESIKKCTSRREKEREGIKAFVKFSVENPMLYNIIWGSLSVDKQLFEDYYESFARNYTRSLATDLKERDNLDFTTLSYALMGASSFLGLRAIFEDMDEGQIDVMIDEVFFPMLMNGVIDVAKQGEKL